MPAVKQLAYLGLTARDVDAWGAYAPATLGLDPVARDPDGTLRLAMDSYHHRFAVHPGERDDLAYMGWQVDGPSSAAKLAARLEGAGVAVTEVSREDLEKRRMTGAVRFTDPDGHPGEIAWGPLDGRSGAEGGFVTGDMGLGHLVIYVSDLARTMEFYTAMLGMRVSDYVGTGGRVPLGFLHCNARHHSLAFAQVPRWQERINHFMLQRVSLDDVGRTYDAVQQTRIPLITTLGKHTNDHMVSFYMRNPSGYGVEYGWGGREIDDATWCVEHLEAGSIWGHRAPPPAEGVAARPLFPGR